jgi:glycosyltransferase involved in cell wall biosynthesis
MKIIYDARHIENIYSGLGRYSASLLVALTEESHLYKDLIILLRSKVDYSKNDHFKNLSNLKGNNISIRYVNSPLYKFRHHLQTSLFVNNYPDYTYFYPHFDIPLFTKVASIFVIHDLKTLKLNGIIRKYEYLKKTYFFQMIKRNLESPKTTCVAVSYSTKKDILSIFGGNYDRKIRVVYEAPFAIYPSLTNRYENITEKYILYVGDRRPYKNLKNTIDIFEILKAKYKYSGNLYLVGQTENHDFNLESYILGKPYIKVVGNVNDEELDSLYSQAEALIYLSKYEGFGLPIVEAAKHNKKIIASNISSIPEICPINTLLVDITSANHLIAKEIINYLQKELYINNRIYLEQFNWNKTANAIFKLL